MGKINKTKYPGVYWIDGVSSDNKPERIYYIKYRRGGKVIEEPVGRQFRDDMTPARASIIRLKKIEGDELPNKEKRREKKSSGRTLDIIYDEYETVKGHKATTIRAESKLYAKHLRPGFGSKTPEEIIQKDFDILLKKLREDEKAPQTIKHICGLLRRLIKYSAEQGYYEGHHKIYPLVASFAGLRLPVNRNRRIRRCPYAARHKKGKKIAPI